MQRLIDADELKMRVILPRCGAKTIIGDAIRKMIDSAPTIEAEVLKCEHCKYNHGRGGVDCELLPQMFGRNEWENYCSLAERRGEDV